MAAVLNPFLCDSVLAEAMLAMVWHFHGLEAQTDDGQLRIQDDRHHFTGAVTLAIQSTQRGWPMQVVKKEAPLGQHQRLVLSDSEHTIQAIIGKGEIRSWEHQRGESFDDILPGTLLQVDIANVILKPNRGRSKRFAIPILVLGSFNIIGCQGENIFGRPSPIHKHGQLSGLNAALIWWAEQKSEPVSEKYAESLIKLHSDYVQQHGDRLTNRYLGWLCDQLGADANEADRNAIKLLARSIPSVSGVLRHSQELSLSMSIPTASCIPESFWSRGDRLKVAAVGERRLKVNGKGNEDAEQRFAPPPSSQLHPSSVISAEDYRERVLEIYSAASNAPSLAFPEYNVTSPTFSPFKRRDGTIRKEQRSLLTDKDESAWTITVSNPPSQPRLPGKTLHSLLAQIKSLSPPEAIVKKDADQQAQEGIAAVAVQSVEGNENQPPSPSQQTVHPSEWGSSPPSLSRRQCPPDTDDERSRSPDSPVLIDSSSCEEPTIATSTCQPRIDREQGIAEAAGYPLEEEPTSPSPAPTPAPAQMPAPIPSPNQVPALVPVSAPSTPAVQIPATASTLEPPVTIQMPATTDRPTTAPMARKRRSAEFEADQDDVEPVEASPEDPKHAAKRARSAFMAEERAKRETVEDAPAVVAAPAPASASTPLQAPNAFTSVTGAATVDPVASFSYPSLLSTSPEITRIVYPPPILSSTSAVITTPDEKTLAFPLATSTLVPDPYLMGPAPAPLPVAADEDSLHAQFAAIYPIYDGDAVHFEALARAAAVASAAGRLPQYAIDDFVLRHRTAYLPYVTEQLAAGATNVAPYEAFWAKEVRNLQATRGVLNAANVRTAAGPGEGEVEQGHGASRGRERRMRMKVSGRRNSREKKEKSARTEKSATKVFAAFAAKRTKM